MKDLQPKRMTIKEVSCDLGVSTDLVQKRVKELFPNKMEPRKTTYLNEYEVTAISVRIKENSSIVSTGDDRRQMPKTELEKEMYINQAMIFQAEKVNNLQLQLQIATNDNEQLQIELDESRQWHTVKKVKTLGYIKDVSARKAWSPLRTWSLENNYQIKTIEDVNYGKVKTYHTDAWFFVYGVVL